MSFIGILRGRVFYRVRYWLGGCFVRVCVIFIVGDICFYLAIFFLGDVNFGVIEFLFIYLVINSIS